MNLNQLDKQASLNKMKIGGVFPKSSSLKMGEVIVPDTPSQCITDLELEGLMNTNIDVITDYPVTPSDINKTILTAQTFVAPIIEPVPVLTEPIVCEALEKTEDTEQESIPDQPKTKK